MDERIEILSGMINNTSKEIEHIIRDIYDNAKNTKLRIEEEITKIEEEKVESEVEDEEIIDEDKDETNEDELLKDEDFDKEV